MSASQRTKGQGGEREIAAIIRDLTGWDIRRRVRQHDGDSDLEGVPGWSVEVKRHKTAGRGEIEAWWRQAVAQAKGTLPALFFRPDGARSWRAVWPLSVHLTMQRTEMWADYVWSVEGSPQAWAAVARELIMAPRLDILQPQPGDHDGQHAEANASQEKEGQEGRLLT